MITFKIQFLLSDNTWSSRYKNPKTDRQSDSSTQWTLAGLNLKIDIYSVKLTYDQKGTAHADTYFSKKMITQSVH